MSKNSKKSKSSKSESSSKKEARKISGKKWGLTMNETWLKLFQQNEKASKGSRLTDEQISKEMRSEFPGRDSKQLETPGVQRFRNHYNKGGLTEGKKPSVQSSRYDEDGNTIERAPRGGGGKSGGGKKKGKDKKGVKTTKERNRIDDEL